MNYYHEIDWTGIANNFWPVLIGLLGILVFVTGYNSVRLAGKGKNKYIVPKDRFYIIQAVVLSIIATVVVYVESSFAIEQIFINAAAVGGDDMFYAELFFVLSPAAVATVIGVILYYIGRFGSLVKRIKIRIEIRIKAEKKRQSSEIKTTKY